MVKLLFQLVACFGLATVSLTAAGQEPVRYPIQIADFAQWEKFPAECAGYRRSTIRSYAPALANYSVTYQSSGSMLVNAVTLYFYPPAKDTSAQLRSEVAQVLNSHEGAFVVDRRVINLDAKGKKYDATLVSFEFPDLMTGSRQPLNSQLWIVFLETGTFKVRSTSPADQRGEAEAAVQGLLQCVAWST